MARFRYYIADTFNGCVKGTNDRDMAVELAACDEYYVIDSEKGEWIDSELTSPSIDEMRRKP